MEEIILENLGEKVSFRNFSEKPLNKLHTFEEKSLWGERENDFLRKGKTLIFDFTHLPAPDEDSL